MKFFGLPEFYDTDVCDQLQARLWPHGIPTIGLRVSIAGWSWGCDPDLVGCCHRIAQQGV
ncbi:MAG: hypothetical protein K2X28_03600 [Alphaproteobacteria bacterium]|nr:hypothetical protein [Alphaproteobacteria bacterium]